VPDAEAAVDAVDVAAEALEHVAGVVLVAGLAEDFAVALGDGVAGDDDDFFAELAGGLQLSENVGGLADGELDDQRGGAAGRADTALGGFMGWDDLELIAGFG
jgi:hypothetical protein